MHERARNRAGIGFQVPLSFPILCVNHLPVLDHCTVSACVAAQSAMKQFNVVS